MPSTTDVASFVEHYSPSAKIHLQPLRTVSGTDAHQEFRTAVIDFVLEEPLSASIELLGDLFVEEARWARETLDVSPHFSHLAELLLRHGGPAALPAFLVGLTTSFDTFGACHWMSLRPDEAANFLSLLETQLPGECDPRTRAELECAWELFHKLAEGTARQGWIRIQPGAPITEVKVAPATLGEAMHAVVRGLWARP